MTAAELADLTAELAAMTEDHISYWLVPSRSTLGTWHRVDIAIDGEPVCDCVGYYNHRYCWHSTTVKEALMTTTETPEQTTAIVPVVLNPPRALLPSAVEFNIITRTAQVAISGAVSLPDGVKTCDQAAAIMLYGFELGIPPMMSLQELYIVKGRVTPKATTMLALVMRNEPDIRCEIVGEVTKEKGCTLHFVRPSRKIDVRYTVTWQDIQTARLDRDMNLLYPKDRLEYHCLKRTLKIYAPDLLMNMGPLAPTISAPDDEEDDEPMDVDDQAVDMTTGEIIESPVSGFDPDIVDRLPFGEEEAQELEHDADWYRAEGMAAHRRVRHSWPDQVYVVAATEFSKRFKRDADPRAIYEYWTACERDSKVPA